MKAKNPPIPGSTLVVREFYIRHKASVDSTGAEIASSGAQHRGLQGPHLGPLFFTLLKAISHAEAREKAILNGTTLSSITVSDQPLSPQPLPSSGSGEGEGGRRATSSSPSSAKGLKRVTGPRKSPTSSSSSVQPTGVEEKKRSRVTDITTLVTAMRKKPQLYGIPPFMPLNPALSSLSTLSQDTPVKCRHESCTFMAMSAKDVEKASMGKMDETGRYISQVGHMWRHETQLFRHPLCNRRTCPVCAFIITNLMSIQKGGITESSLQLEGGEEREEEEEASSSIGEGREGGINTGSSSSSRDIGGIFENTATADETMIESAEASI
jgi:hypothetical protein